MKRGEHLNTYTHIHAYMHICLCICILFRSSVSVFVLSFNSTSVVVFLRCLSVWRVCQGSLFRLFEISATPFNFWRTCCASLSSAGFTTTTVTDEQLWYWYFQFHWYCALHSHWAIISMQHRRVLRFLVCGFWHVSTVIGKHERLPKRGIYVDGFFVMLPYSWLENKMTQN